jgi:hypothetical protein
MTVAPARDTTAEVIMPSPMFSASYLRSDQSQPAPKTAIMVAMIMGTSSGRSSLIGIVSVRALIRELLFAESPLEEVKKAPALMAWTGPSELTGLAGPGPNSI